MLKARPQLVDVTSMSRVALCMIVRDEAAHLGACLDAARPHVDELCVLDTGSVDGTIKIARAAGAKVGRFAWCDDFAAARNAALRLATATHVLSLDADERLEGADAGARLRAFATKLPRAAGRITMIDDGDLGEGRSRIVRFFPLAGASWSGRIHEQVRLDDAVPPSADTGVVARHYGYRTTEILGREKVERNLKLLRAAIQDDPSSAYDWFQLARTLFVGARYEEAVEPFAMALEQIEPDAPYLPLLVELFGHCLRRLNRSAEALELIGAITPAFRNRSDTCYVEGVLALDVGEFERAEALLQRCLTLKDPGGKGGDSQKMTRTFGPAYHLGCLREFLGMQDEAIAYYRKALEFQPGHPESLAGLKRCAGGAAAPTS